MRHVPTTIKIKVEFALNLFPSPYTTKTAPLQFRFNRHYNFIFTAHSLQRQQFRAGAEKNAAPSTKRRPVDTSPFDNNSLWIYRIQTVARWALSTWLFHFVFASHKCNRFSMQSTLHHFLQHYIVNISSRKCCICAGAYSLALLFAPPAHGREVYLLK